MALDDASAIDCRKAGLLHAPQLAFRRFCIGQIASLAEVRHGKCVAVHVLWALRQICEKSRLLLTPFYLNRERRHLAALSSHILTRAAGLFCSDKPSGPFQGFPKFPHWFVNYLAFLHGVPLDSYKIVAVGAQSSAIGALQRGTIDIWAGFDPGATRPLAPDGSARVLGDARSASGLRSLIGSDIYPGAVLYSQGPAARARYPQFFAVDSAARAGRIVLKVPQNDKGDDPSLYEQAVRNCHEMFSPDGLMPSAGPEIVRKVLSVFIPELQNAQFDIQQTWTNEFLER